MWDSSRQIFTLSLINDTVCTLILFKAAGQTGFNVLQRKVGKIRRHITRYLNDVDRVVLWFFLTGDPDFGNSAGLPISASRRSPKTTISHGEWHTGPWQKEV